MSFRGRCTGVMSHSDRDGGFAPFRYPAARRSSSACRGGGDESPEQAGVCSHLGVPLHRGAQPVAACLHRLEQAVLGPGRGRETRVGPHRLVVMAVHRQGRRRARPRAGSPVPATPRSRRRHRRRDCAARGRPGRARAGRGRRPHGRPSPACHGRPRARVGRPRPPRRAAPAPSRRGRRASSAVCSCGCSPYRCGRHVRSAADHQAVEPGDHGGGGLGVRRGRGQQHRHAPATSIARAYVVGSRSADWSQAPQRACSR